jgi:biopolymer transport protein ExbD
VEITIPDSFRQSQLLFIGKDQVRSQVFQERVRQLMEHRSDKQVFLRGDAGVQYQDLMDVIDMLKAAGVQNIGMVARMPAPR